MYRRLEKEAIQSHYSSKFPVLDFHAFSVCYLLINRASFRVTLKNSFLACLRFVSCAGSYSCKRIKTASFAGFPAKMSLIW